MAENISKEEFVIRAIKNLRRPPYKGIHSVYSGFNEAFLKEFQEKSIATTNQMAKDGKLCLRPVRGGVMLYLPEDAPPSLNVQAVLDKIKS